MTIPRIRAKRSALALILVIGMTSGLAPAALAQVSLSPPAGPLGAAKSWGYQLQNPDVKTLSAAPYDVLVIDYSRDGTEDGVLKPADLAKLKTKPDGTKRIVLCYMSIGEAEDYRYYWKKRWGWFSWLPRWSIFSWFVPAWLGPGNKEWHGNYGVRYWDPGWQNVILGSGDGYLERIARAGFDGVYLDKIDEHQDMKTHNIKAAQDMMTFVKRIADRGRALKPEFLIVPQNGEELLSNPAYRAAIDGIGKEDLLFGEDGDGKPNKADQIADNLAKLKLLTNDRKPVLAVEYLDDPKVITSTRKTLEEYGFVPHFANRALDRMRMSDLPVPGEKKGRR